MTATVSLSKVPLSQIHNLQEAISAALKDANSPLSDGARDTIRQISTGLRWFDLSLTERILLRATWEIYNRYPCPLELNSWG